MPAQPGLGWCSCRRSRVLDGASPDSEAPGGRVTAGRWPEWAATAFPSRSESSGPGDSDSEGRPVWGGRLPRLGPRAAAVPAEDSELLPRSRRRCIQVRHRFRLGVGPLAGAAGGIRVMMLVRAGPGVGAPGPVGPTRYASSSPCSHAPAPSAHAGTVSPGSAAASADSNSAPPTPRRAPRSLSGLSPSPRL